MGEYARQLAEAARLRAKRLNMDRSAVRADQEKRRRLRDNTKGVEVFVDSKPPRHELGAVEQELKSRVAIEMKRRIEELERKAAGLPKKPHPNSRKKPSGDKKERSPPAAYEDFEDDE